MNLESWGKSILIQAEKIKKQFDDFVLFEDFSIEGGPGEFIGIYGESGSGKTTIMNILGLIEDYDAGQIKYKNQLVTSSADKSKLLADEIGFIFQNYALISNKSIAYNFKFIRNNVMTIEESMKIVGLDYLVLNRKVFTLSGGEQQRVAIARTIYKGCSIIFADEPTAAVDEDNKLKIMSIFSELVSKDVSILVVTHDLSLKEYFDRLIYLESNRHK